MSGIDIDGRSVRKGAADAVRRWTRNGGSVPGEVDTARSTGSPPRAGRPLSSRRIGRALGVVELKDVVKQGMRERFDEMRRMGIER